MKPHPFLASALAGLSLAADALAAKPDPDKIARTVILDETAVKNLRIETAEATEVPFEETLFALGRVDVLPGNRAVLSSRIAGRALKVMAQPDHEVKAGDPLVVVESRQPGDPPPQITLTAPISGFVTELAVTAGEPVNPDKPLLAIVDLSMVYALAAVPEHLAAQVRPGQPARVTSPGWPGEVWETQVEHIGALADADAGTIEAAFHVKNEGLWLRPGMRLEFNLITRTRPEVLAVPKAAVQGEGGNRFVFVADVELKNAFVKSPVVIGAQNDQFTEILTGVFAGDPVVTRGSYSLSFAGKGSVSLKDALDAAHGHEHNADGSEITREGGANAAGAHGSDHDHGPGPDHTAASNAGMSALTMASFAGNGVLLLLLALAAWRRPATTPSVPATDNAPTLQGGNRDAQ